MSETVITKSGKIIVISKEKLEEAEGNGSGVVRVISEVPTGALNGSNATFTTLFPFIPDTETVYSNGLRLKKVDDYNTTGNSTIILTFSPASSETILVDYNKL